MSRDQGPLDNVGWGPTTPGQRRRMEQAEAARIAEVRSLATPRTPEIVIDEDDFRAAVAVVHHVRGGAPCTDKDRQLIDLFTPAIGPVRPETLREFEELFAGGPDTPCRTAWRSEGHD